MSETPFTDDNELHIIMHIQLSIGLGGVVMGGMCECVCVQRVRTA